MIMYLRDILKNKFKEKYIYYVFAIYMFSLFTYDTCIQYSTQLVPLITKFIRYSSYLIFFIYDILSIRKEKKVSWQILVFFITSIFMAILGKNKNFLFLIIFLYAIKDLDFKKLIKICIYIYATSFILTVSLSLLGIIPDWTYTRKEIIRHSLGFYYATSTMSIFLLIVLMYFYIRRNKFNYLELLVIETINFILYKFTDGRMGFILVTMIVITMLISKIELFRKIFMHKSISKITKVLAYTLPTILLILSIFLAISYGNNFEFAKKANVFLNQRVKLSYEAFETYPVKLFGNNIEWVGNGGQGYVQFEQKQYNYVDSSYIRIIFDFGLIGTLIVLYLYTKALVYSINKKDYYLYISIMFVLIWSFIEPYMFNVGRNIFIITFSFVFNENDFIGKIRNKLKREKEEVNE